MPACKITVLKTLYHADLADEYRRDDIHQGPCPFFSEGDEFIVNPYGDRPEEFKCDWAWNDLQKIVLAMTLDSNFGRWMKNPDTFISCCTDGIKPVVFKLEKA